MKRSLLTYFKPTLQVQFFLSTIFRLQRLIRSKTHSSKLIDSDISFWNEDLGILHELKNQVKNMLRTYPFESLHAALTTAISSCEKREEPEWNALFQLTAEFIQRCEQEENLYYFLLRHQEDCKNTFGRLFLFNLFNKHGINQTKQFLIDKYSERGFFHLEKSIANHFEGLIDASDLLGIDSAH